MRVTALEVAREPRPWPARVGGAGDAPSSPTALPYRYGVFGGVLASAIEFPDLSPASATHADWEFRIATGAPPDVSGAEEVGRHAVGRAEMRLVRYEGGLRLSYPPFGECMIEAGGRSLTWYGGNDPRLEFVRAIALGPVLALALHETGILCLHGSSVAFADHAIAMLAPKFHGKSTLALALAGAGARLVTDDAIAVDLGTPPMVRPGVHSVRLWDDTANALVTGDRDGRMVAGVKGTLVSIPEQRLATARVPLGAVYLLVPTSGPDDAPPVERVLMGRGQATVAMAFHTKLADPLIGVRMSTEQLRWVAVLARQIPVYTLGVARDFARLPEVVRQMMEWHAPDHVPDRQDAE
jgi:hypothetical protein